MPPRLAQGVLPQLCLFRGRLYAAANFLNRSHPRRLESHNSRRGHLAMPHAGCPHLQRSAGSICGHGSG